MWWILILTAVVVVFLSYSFMFEELIVWIHPSFSVCFRKDMLFNWTVFWIILGVLGKIIITIIVILDLCMVGADSSVSYWSGRSIFSIICDMISSFSLSQIDNNPWAIRGSAFHRQHFIMKFSASWSAVLPFINMTRETYKSWNVMSNSDICRM